ncbi:MAG: DNA mismatch repair endonuclease MutL [Treponemataceae bacterium]
MTKNKTLHNDPKPIKKLPDEAARKIAAGEVIDRPNAIIRELLDNCIDAGATQVIVEIEGGGIEKIRIVDDGYGMTKEDLETCAFPHTTSKIYSEKDLLTLSTLGFRGEALASIAAVSRLEIVSIRKEIAYKLTASLGSEYSVTSAQLAKGTIVQSQALFENFPARRIFLKRPTTEGNLCRQTFIEKALPWNTIAFRLSMDGKVKLDFPANQTLTERFLSALELSEKEYFFSEITGQAEGFSFSIVLSHPNMHRSDKKNLYVFVNGRRVWEFSLIQAIEYGAQGYFPNGCHPIASLYLTIDSSLVDFNIHPAKKEVRFKDSSSVYRAVSGAVRNFYKNHAVQHLIKDMDSSNEFQYDFDDPQKESENAVKEAFEYKAHTPRSFSEKSFTHNSFTLPKTFEKSSFSANTSHASFSTSTHSVEKKPENHTVVHPLSKGFIYKGTILGVFLLVEKDNTIFLLDQHACHERILFNQFMNEAGQKQKLLFPYIVETQSKEEDNYLHSLETELKNSGFEMTFDGNGRWEFFTVPIRWIGNEENLREDLLEKTIQPKELMYKLAAKTACRGAIKDGSVLDDAIASRLIEDIFALNDTTCPHGRPLWTIITKEELYKRVRRID